MCPSFMGVTAACSCCVSKPLDDSGSDFFGILPAACRMCGMTYVGIGPLFVSSELRVKDFGISLQLVCQVICRFHRGGGVMGRNAISHPSSNEAPGGLVRSMWFFASGSPWLSRECSVNLPGMELMGAVVLRSFVAPKHHSLMSLGWSMNGRLPQALSALVDRREV